MHKVVMAAGERVSLSRSKQGGLMNQLYCGVDIAKETVPIGIGMSPLQEPPPSIPIAIGTTGLQGRAQVAP